MGRIQDAFKAATGVPVVGIRMGPAGPSLTEAVLPGLASAAAAEGHPFLPPPSATHLPAILAAEEARTGAGFRVHIISRRRGTTSLVAPPPSTKRNHRTYSICVLEDEESQTFRLLSAEVDGRLRTATHSAETFQEAKQADAPTLAEEGEAEPLQEVGEVASAGPAWKEEARQALFALVLHQASDMLKNKPLDLGLCAISFYDEAAAAALARWRGDGGMASFLADLRLPAETTFLEDNETVLLSLASFRDGLYKEARKACL